MRHTGSGGPQGGSSGGAGHGASWTFPLAYLGAHLAFMPVLVLLLPRRVQALVGDEAPLVLSWLLLLGALTASAAHILSGHWSDRWIVRYGSRRGLIAMGLAALLASFALFAAAGSVVQIGAALVAFQLALNLAFAPLGALLADHVPDGSKGSVAGFLGAALPLSSAGVGLLAWLFPEDSGTAFVVNGLLVAACMLPLLVLWGFRHRPSSSPPPPSVTAAGFDKGRYDFVLAWLSRFLIQLGAAFVIGFLFLLVSNRIQTDPEWAGRRSASDAIALLSLAATLVAIFGAIAGGRLSDQLRVRRVPLSIAAGISAASLVALGWGVAWPFFIGAYALFQLALSAFLAIDSALVAQLVGDSPRRGALMGVMNLANTFPAVLAPAVAIASLDTVLVQERLGVYVSASAVAAACAAMVVLRIRRVR